MAGRWLFKTEPSAYSFDQLRRDGSTVWDGVGNALALKHLAAVARGDQVLVYHTGQERAVVGIARAASDAYPNPRQRDPRLVVVDLRPVRALRRPVSLAEMRASRGLAGFELLRLPRLSVMPVSARQWAEVLDLARTQVRPVAGLLLLLGFGLTARSALLLAGRGRPRRGPQPAFVLAGPYVRVRNPLLGGLLLALAGAALGTRSPVLAAGAGVAALAAHVFVVRFEEPRLRERFGAAYAEYLKRVPRWLPAVWRPRSEATD